jgi:hypothetical protein
MARRDCAAIDFLILKERAGRLRVIMAPAIARGVLFESVPADWLARDQTLAGFLIALRC